MPAELPNIVAEFEKLFSKRFNDLIDTEDPQEKSERISKFIYNILPALEILISESEANLKVDQTSINELKEIIRRNYPEKKTERLIGQIGSLFDQQMLKQLAGREFDTEDVKNAIGAFYQEFYAGTYSKDEISPFSNALIESPQEMESAADGEPTLPPLQDRTEGLILNTSLSLSRLRTIAKRIDPTGNSTDILLQLKNEFSQLEDHVAKKNLQKTLDLLVESFGLNEPVSTLRLKKALGAAHKIILETASDVMSMYGPIIYNSFYDSLLPQGADHGQLNPETAQKAKNLSEKFYIALKIFSKKISNTTKKNKLSKQEKRELLIDLGKEQLGENNGALVEALLNNPHFVEEFVYRYLNLLIERIDEND